MTKSLGPTFGDEIRVSGPVLPISWGATDETIFGRENLSAEDNARLDQVIAKHDPTATTYLAPTLDMGGTVVEIVGTEERQ